MENRIQRIFLMPLFSVSALTLGILTISAPTFAAEAEVNSTVAVKANVERRDVVEDLLDTENFEVGIQGGIMSIEDFESSPWVSAHLGYHISEHFYVKANYAQAKAGETSFEKLANAAPLLTDAERELTYYGLNIGYTLLPGEIFFSKDRVFNSAFSFELGGGSTEFAGDEQFTVNLTANYRVFLTDWLAWDLSMSDYLFNTEVTGSSKTTHNLTFATGVAFYF
ncbi:outer membrane beta-barrel domain-containing protein [Shewanella sp. OMA3-2]|uniref:outer membrane beta-barrel domain-containing protein n=1 Tax=Shewanella sp. OMA3-2 TaxID=2908650 RepID=UPI001F1C5D6E|nr:outer membrane beta-barrel domain-containing protein [Shewanella sp. OMA3-2]UJF21177.1 outer membrane beta-barrel domain-containing protein [Shewanella sp. OMA3-2]